MAKPTVSSTRTKTKVSRKGIHSKKNNSKNKASKNYVKANRGQGK